MAYLPILTDIYETLFGRPQRAQVVPTPRWPEQTARDRLALQLAQQGQAAYRTLQARGPQRLTPREISEIIDRTYGQIGAGAVGSGVAKRLAGEAVERRGRELELGYEDELSRAAARAYSPLGAIGGQPAGTVVTRPEDLGMLRALVSGMAGRVGARASDWLLGPSEEEQQSRRRSRLMEDLITRQLSGMPTNQWW